MDKRNYSVAKISFDEYLEAFEKVKKFNQQLAEELLVTQLKTAKSQNTDKVLLIAELLKEHGNKRTLNAVLSFLDSEIRFGKISFESAVQVTLSFFVERYRRKDLKKIGMFGAGSFVDLQKILAKYGYQLKP